MPGGKAATHEEDQSPCPGEVTPKPVVRKQKYILLTLYHLIYYARVLFLFPSRGTKATAHSALKEITSNARENRGNQNSWKYQKKTVKFRKMGKYRVGSPLSGGMLANKLRCRSRETR